MIVGPIKKKNTRSVSTLDFYLDENAIFCQAEVLACH